VLRQRAVMAYRGREHKECAQDHVPVLPLDNI
jgi:hypothetical protein